MYTAESIKAALIEAAEIESRMRGPRGPSGPRTSWPVHKREADDVAGYYTGEDDDEIQIGVSSAELTKHDMVAGWLRQHISNDSDRRLIWSWAESTARGAFTGFCRERRLDPIATATRVDRVAKGLATTLSSMRDTKPLQTAANPATLRTLSEVRPKFSR